MPEIQMPKLSDTMTEGTLVAWKKKKGDKVSTGEVIAEIETDKATMEWESPEDGTLTEIYVEEGGKVNVGDKIAFIGEEGRSAAGERRGQGKKGAGKTAAEKGKKRRRRRRKSLRPRKRKKTRPRRRRRRQRPPKPSRVEEACRKAEGTLHPTKRASRRRRSRDGWPAEQGVDISQRQGHRPGRARNGKRRAGGDEIKGTGAKAPAQKSAAPAAIRAGRRAPHQS